MSNPTFLSVEQIVEKKQRGEVLTAWESSVYRLNFRDDGTRYSSDPDVREEQYALDNDKTMAGRFVKAAQRLRTSRGGRPTATLENGRIVFTYPDGTTQGKV